ncbi:MAG: hypothetical protein H6836_03385 [Planctomycetes bacterium]|nr:hypothetical protein [Planctomycetota bacterium]MCB9888595.1 hypothetical protein [Planctomycetota bacterium]
MSPAILRTAFLSTLGFALAACSGGGGGSAPAPVTPPNLQVAALQVTSPDPTSAHELDIETTLTSATTVQNVSISYYVIHKQDLDDKVPEPRQFLVATDVLPEVAAGTKVYPRTIIIPKEVAPRGDWYLTTRVDPLDQIAESNEDDNVPPENSPDIVIAVNHDNIDTPDFTVESVTLDDLAMVLTPNRVRAAVANFKDVPEHHGGLTVVCQVTGSKDYKAVSIKVEVVNGQTTLPLEIWRESQTNYANTFYADLIAGQPNSVHIDLHVPDAVLAKLLPLVVAGQRQFTLRVTLNVGHSIAEWENGVRRINQRDDDVVELPLVLIDPATLPSKACFKYEQDFTKSWHNDIVAAGVEFHGGAYLDDRGAVAEARGALPVTLFKKRIDFFRGEAYGQLAPHRPKDTQFHIDVDVLGLTVYQRASVDPTYTYTDTPFKKVESIEAKSTIFCGPVPIVFTTGAQGELGYKLTFEMDSGNMSLAGTPYAELSAHASAVVYLGVVKGGVKGEMSLIRDDYENKVSFGEVILLNGGTAIRSTLRMTVTNTLTGPNGRLYLFADYPGVKWCSTFLGRIPCGIQWHHAEKTLVKFQTFQKQDVLLNESSTTTALLNCQ